MSELKPCPFCGGGAQVNTWTMHGITESRCFCSNSDCPNSVRTVALEQWNTRPIEDKLQSRIAELEAYIDQLIEVGNGMKSFLTPYVDGFRDSYPATSAWESLVKDWKEREE